MSGAAKRKRRDDLACQLQFDPEKLLIARLWVARLGEGNVQGWWRTSGLLGADGAFVGPRVLPITHPTARARVVFAVAAHACAERYPNRKAFHLFRLDPEIEDRLDALLVTKLEDSRFWKEIIARLEAVTSTEDPAAILTEVGVTTDDDVRYVQRLTLGPDGRSVAISPGSSPEETLRRLAAGFARSPKRELTVPYIVVE